MSSVSRTQHIVPSVLVLILSITVAYLSFTREPAAAFLFPRIISVVMLGLSIWNFIRAISGLARIGKGLSATELKNILPGVVVMFVFIFYGAKNVGFYLSSSVAFFVLYTVYDSHSHTKLGVWIKRLVVTVVFMLVIYLLFSVLLKVQTPRGIWR